MVGECGMPSTERALILQPARAAMQRAAPRDPADRHTLERAPIRERGVHALSRRDWYTPKLLPLFPLCSEFLFFLARVRDDFCLGGVSVALSPLDLLSWFHIFYLYLIRWG